MAVANHPLCEPVRFAHYKALVPIREVDGIVYVSGHGPEDIKTILSREQPRMLQIFSSTSIVTGWLLESFAKVAELTPS